MNRYAFSLIVAFASAVTMAQTPPAPQTPGAINSKPPIGASKSTQESTDSPIVKDQADAKGKRSPGAPVVVDDTQGKPAADKSPTRTADAAKADTKPDNSAATRPAGPMTPEQKKTCEDSAVKSRVDACTNRTPEAK